MRLATWNVLHGARDHRSPAQTQALVEGVASLDADVVALQEVDRFQPRSGTVDQLAECAAGFADSRFEPAILGTPGGDWRACVEDDGGVAYGIGILTRLPVRAWHVLRLRAAPFRLPVRATGGRLQLFGDEPRVALAAELDGITVIATHLSFVPGWNVKHLRAVTRWAATLPGPHVLLGDLNAGPLLVRTAGWDLLAHEATFPSSRPRRRIDHVLGHGPLPPVTRVQVPEMAISDHRPLIVTLG